MNTFQQKSYMYDRCYDVYDSLHVKLNESFSLSGVVFTYRRRNGRVVEVVGESGQHSSVVRVLLLVFHEHVERQLLVVGADHSGSRAATQGH